MGVGFELFFFRFVWGRGRFWLGPNAQHDLCTGTAHYSIWMSIWGPRIIMTTIVLLGPANDSPSLFTGVATNGEYFASEMSWLSCPGQTSLGPVCRGFPSSLQTLWRERTQGGHVIQCCSHQQVQSLLLFYFYFAFTLLHLLPKIKIQYTCIRK